MIQILIFIAILATAVLIYFNNRVRNRKIDRRNRLTERQEALMHMLKKKNTHENNAGKS
jgi:4-hydroxybenzoate polyprenyltransferase